jgi:hypothetical protein
MSTVLKCPKLRDTDAPEVTQSAQCALNLANDDLDHFENGSDAAEQVKAFQRDHC